MMVVITYLHSLMSFCFISKSPDGALLEHSVLITVKVLQRMSQNKPTFSFGTNFYKSTQVNLKIKMISLLYPNLINFC